jgi:hypothetical protein
VIDDDAHFLGKRIDAGGDQGQFRVAVTLLCCESRNVNGSDEREKSRGRYHAACRE